MLGKHNTGQHFFRDFAGCTIWHIQPHGVTMMTLNQLMSSMVGPTHCGNVEHIPRRSLSYNDPYGAHNHNTTTLTLHAQAMNADYTPIEAPASLVGITPATGSPQVHCTCWQQSRRAACNDQHVSTIITTLANNNDHTTAAGSCSSTLVQRNGSLQSL
jgi:hypothetical protein